MILKGILYILLIIFSAVFLIVSLVMGAMKFTSNSKTAMKWLIGFLLSLAVMIFAIIMLVRGVVGKAKAFGEDMVTMAEQKAAEMDSLNNLYTNSHDSILKSQSVAYLISLEPDSMKGRVPSQFYSYLGFRDYYRLPLVWPFSLHCTDSLGDATLYDESYVQQFDVNDNGERSCDIHGIMDFEFTQDHLIGKKVRIEEKPKANYFAYDLKKRTQKEFNSYRELMNFASANGFDPNTHLKSCRVYYNEFQK
jgi:hypothetical protein